MLKIVENLEMAENFEIFRALYFVRIRKILQIKFTIWSVYQRELKIGATLELIHELQGNFKRERRVIAVFRMTLLLFLLFRIRRC